MNNANLGLRSPSNIGEALDSVPKVDLHRHLTGSIRLSTLEEIVGGYGVPVPQRVKEHLSSYIVHSHPTRGLRGFLSSWWILDKIVRHEGVMKEQFGRIVLEILEDAAADNVRYLELRMSPHGVANGSGVRLEDLLETMSRSFGVGRAKLGIHARMILSLRRQDVGSPRFSHRARQKYYDALLESACAFKDRPVVGFDLTGLETDSYPPSLFSEFFARAKAKGFKVTVHAGEFSNPEFVWEAIDVLHADRVGHGIAAVTDGELMKTLSTRGIPLELCPTCNYLAGAVASIASHPVRALHAAGVLVTINTDSPLVCGELTLTHEYEQLRDQAGLSWEELWSMDLNGLDAAFVSGSDKAVVEGSFFEPSFEVAQSG